MMNDTNKSIEIANTILVQMGGAGRIRAMVGAKTFVTIENGVRFYFPNRERTRGNCVEIVLAGDDTYTVSFWNTSKKAARLSRKFDGIYCDQIKGCFEKQTGLRLSI